MSLSAKVTAAFDLIGASIDATREDASKAYRKLALQCHPDKNRDDPTATERFQELGAAWSIVNAHYDNPAASFIPDPTKGMKKEDVAEFFAFVFEELFFGRQASYSDFRRERRAETGPQPPPEFYYYTYAPPPPPSKKQRGIRSQQHFEQQQRNEEYQQRVKAFELQCAAEEREKKKAEQEAIRQEEELRSAYHNAFAAARAGDTSTVVHLFSQYSLDVNSPEHRPKSKNVTNKSTEPRYFTTMLHAACRKGDERLLAFLLDKGAKTDAMNDAKMYPFHVALSCGNVGAVKLLIQRRQHGEPLPGCHPSKATASGRPPLLLAIEGGNAEIVELMTKEATVSQVDSCWELAAALPFQDILVVKKGFVDPDTQEILDEAAETERLEAERTAAAAKKERKHQRNAERIARRQEEALLAAQKQEQEELAQQRREAEEQARREADRLAKEQVEREEARQAAEQARRDAERLAKEQAVEKHKAKERQKAKERAEARAMAILKQEREKKERQRQKEVLDRQRKAAEAEERQREAKKAQTLSRLRAQAEEMERAKSRPAAKVQSPQVKVRVSVPGPPPQPVQFWPAEMENAQTCALSPFSYSVRSTHWLQPSVLVTPTETRSESATSGSSLAYYFGAVSESENEIPPLPTAKTPDHPHTSEPVTPARSDPALIDRRGLVGVGELATPRWTRSRHAKDDTVTPSLDALGEDAEEHPDAPDSPWTIEAVESDKEEVFSSPCMPFDACSQIVKVDPSHQPPPRTIRERPSMTEESGGEEILYPRKANPAELPPQPSPPPSAFAQPKRARKRTSDEFELDQTGSLVSKRTPKSPKEEKPSARKHRSLNVTSPNKTKDRRRESTGLAHSNSLKIVSHSRHASTSSSSSNHADTSRRVHTTDFSHLPPSPSSSSILTFLKQPNTPQTPPLVARDSIQSHASPNVAHSLLRGTQEGWSGLDDEATTEALRKLDGLSNKTARARASISSFTRPSNSRPGTPAKTTAQWEGIGPMDPGRRASASSTKERAVAVEGGLETADMVGSAISSDEQPLSPSVVAEKTPKKGTSSARSSLNPKRTSASSTTYASTPTTSSRDSASMSVTTAATSISAASSRHSLKARRNSAGSDASSIHSSDAASLKDRVASLATNSEPPEDAIVPPVPPLPKNLTTYRSPTGVTFPSVSTSDGEDKPRKSHDSDRVVALDVPSSANSRRRSQPSSGYSTTTSSAPEPSPVIKTPSKKWSFSNALNLRLSGSPSGASASPKSPRSVTFGQQLRKSTSKDQALSPAAVVMANPWEQPAAMSSAASLASMSSVGSVRSPSLQPTTSRKTPDRGPVTSRTGTDSSASTNAQPSAQPLSPTSSVRRNQSKRLTPSSIPFFRRSSSQSMQVPVAAPIPSSPTHSTGYSTVSVRSKGDSDHNPTSTSTPGKKSSVLSLLKSSSRRSLHADSKDAARELQKIKEAEKEKERQAKLEKERLKKEEKSRAESRISVLMGRQRGKTLSSADPPPRKNKSPVQLPPLQIAALEPATAQRVARLKSTSSANSTPSSTPSSSTRTVSSSRVTSQTVSSMQKQSDSSLRSSRNLLPTIAGSPSVATNGVAAASKEAKEAPPSSLSNSVSGLPKETPTKIPRISSRTSTVGSPMQKGGATSRRASASLVGPSSTNPSPTGVLTNEFGVLTESETDSGGGKTVSGPTRTNSVRASPATVSTSRVPRQSVGPSTSTHNVLTRKPNRDSISFTGLRKSSTSSIATSSTQAPSDTNTTTSHHRFSALSPSRGLKLLSPKIGLSSNRASNSTSTQSIQQVANSPSSSRQSLSTPSPVPSSVDDEEVQGDEEMMHYIRRQHAKKLAAGASQQELDELLQFPEPIPPGAPLSPSAVLKGSQNQYLSEYERKGDPGLSPAVLDNSTNNYGYDDERGDYLVVNRDHLAYRYEVMDTLGKGSFGQVLHCRDHCTGESVAIKIIRNKKRFHHQAIVEIKILDNLRKWDPDEKHHVIKMTENFYFRGHLCIAMELLSINLYELIKANGFVGFTTTLIRRFTSQMLLSLSLMRHHRIVHCDLKPENVLLRHPAKSGIKVIDFGSSCLEHEKIYTYIQSRFYRSPEVILGMNYHMAIDMWSLGCILAELYTGFPIFPGENEQEQLSCIMEVLGVPDKEFVNRSTRKKLFFDPNGTPRVVVNSKGRRRRPGSKTLAQVLRCNDEDFVDFIAKCLVWDPERRIKPQAAMRHPFMLAGKRPKPSPTPSSTPKAASSSTLGSSRTKSLLETPKKSLIGAPTPLTARTTRTAGNGVPTTPGNSTTQSSTLGSSRSYRTTQSQSLSNYHSSRTLNGIAVCSVSSRLDSNSTTMAMLSSLRTTSTELLQRYAQAPPSINLNLASLLSFGRPV
ncbi:CMGC/DYRK/DYRK2 protein kinase [Mycena chlorophos]|uniref:CMGC/DYRK/DYRK2 protein kinase n=1 Tax=Mycena chlorophos TaxID=658473 RepID=A0A8H6WL63_MYCCL|nr:CMGC/DYRK/DYRK2 protein kinase [Mycena chlorophos]